MNTDRSNTDLSAIVDETIAMVEKEGVRAAADFLAARGASFALICRVLGKQARRRATALYAEAAPKLPNER